MKNKIPKIIFFLEVGGVGAWMGAWFVDCWDIILTRLINIVLKNFPSIVKSANNLQHTPHPFPF